jgi:N-acetyl-gamma-glutamyl-phosphate reductase
MARESGAGSSSAVRPAQRITVAVVGATGYTGAELVRLLSQHPAVELRGLYAQSRAGRPIAEAVPSLHGVLDVEVASFSADAVAADAGVAFVALPHGASAPVVRELRARGVIVLDLSADFRLRDLDVHRVWYGEHGAPELAASAVYGLVELHRDELRGADLIAVPGCYPTVSVLLLAPLVRDGHVDRRGLIVDAKSGVSGAGRTPKESTHLPETAEGIRAYAAAGKHRHTSEIEQELSRIADEEVRVTFTPHLVPMTRGILATAYGEATGATTAERCTESARAVYEGSPSVVVLPPGSHPDTLWVRGSNRVHLSYSIDERTGRVVALATIDNLVKGAAGQAVQAFNVRFGLPEGLALGAPAIWP